MLERLFGTPYPQTRRVIVHTHEGRSFRAVFWRQRSACIVLRDAMMLAPGHEPTPVDGEVLIFRPQVTFIQVLAEGAR